MRKHRRHSFFETTALGGQMKDEVRSEINVTPLVDVMLVLLIIFMVVTPLLQGAGMAVDLPQATEPDKVPEVPSQETVSVRADGVVFLGKTPLSEKGMAQAFLDLYRQKPDAEMVVKGDRKVQYRKVREVMKLLNEAGYKNVGLIATKQKAGG